MKCEFKIGDIVRLKTGHSPQKIVDIRRSYGTHEYELRCMYLSALHYNDDYGERYSRWRREKDYVLCVEDPVQQLPGEENIVPDLYQLKKEPERFGIALQNSAGQLLRNSNGHVILEMKGESGKVEAFPEDDIELVTPFTVNLIRLTVGGDKGSETQIHVIAEAGQVQKDDVLLELNTGHLWRVTALDTKCRSARDNRSKWIKLSTETIKFGLSD